MDPATLVAVGQSMAPLIGQYMQYRGQQQTNAANAQMAQRQMDFQERMRSTQYQTAVDDIRKAGLNPALAYGQGGAGTPGGASAVMANPWTGAAQNAAAAASFQLQMKQAKANIDLTEAQARKTSSEATTAGNMGPVQVAIARLEEQIRTFDRDMSSAQREAIHDRIAAELANLRALSRATNARGALDELQRPAYENQARADQMFYRRTLAPHINDAGSVIRTGLEVRGARRGEMWQDYMRERSDRDFNYRRERDKRASNTMDVYYDQYGRYTGHRESRRENR